MKQLIWEINRKFHLFPKYRPVPHVSLAGPFTTNDSRRLVSDFKSLCEKQDLMNFTVEGFGTFENNGVVFININPDKKLDEFRWELSKTLQPYCNLRQYDY
ncbi:MAG: 2'-5' RNA ligase family protein, partial [Nanoarchaeota archaeon]